MAAEDRDRIVCAPGWFVSKLREKAVQELSESESNANEQEKPFVSESNTLLAWSTRTVFRAHSPSPKRPISILNVFNIRSVLPDLFPVNTANMGNSLTICQTHLPYSFINQQPLGSVASQFRQSLVAQRTRDQVEALAAIENQAMQQTGHPPILGLSDMLIFGCSNWHQARFFEVDFSSAVLKQGIPGDKRFSAVSKPSLILPGSLEVRIPMGNIGCVMGKDPRGELVVVVLFGEGDLGEG